MMIASSFSLKMNHPFLSFQIQATLFVFMFFCSISLSLTASIAGCYLVSQRI